MRGETGGWTETAGGNGRRKRTAETAGGSGRRAESAGERKRRADGRGGDLLPGQRRRGAGHDGTRAMQPAAAAHRASESEAAMSARGGLGTREGRRWRGNEHRRGSGHVGLGKRTTSFICRAWCCVCPSLVRCRRALGIDGSVQGIFVFVMSRHHLRANDTPPLQTAVEESVRR